jgi:hypothetical protein
MNKSNINRIEPIAPLPSYSKYSCRGKVGECLLGKSMESVEFTKAREDKLREMEEEELKNRYEKERPSEIRKKHGEEMVNREMDKKKELIDDIEQLEECKNKIKVCGLCGEQLDPSDFYFDNTKNENTVVMVGNGKYKKHGRNALPLPVEKKGVIYDYLGQYGENRLSKSLGITLDQLYDDYLERCNIFNDVNTFSKDFKDDLDEYKTSYKTDCLEETTSEENLKRIAEKLKKIAEIGDFSYTDIECGHKFHKKCILEWIKEKKGQVTGDKVIGRSIDPTTRIGNKRPYTRIGFQNFNAPVTCPTCSEPIRQLYYFLPTYCDKIDETGEFIRRKLHITTQNKTKKNLTFADDKNETRFYDKTSETDQIEYGGKRNRVRKTRRKNRKHKKTRKYKKN